jgi:hypothetical protein
MMAEVFDHEGMNRITVFAALALLEEDAVEEELLSRWSGCDIAHTAAKSVNNKTLVIDLYHTVVTPLTSH